MTHPDVVLPAQPGMGLYSMVAEFFTEDWRVAGEVRGPEPRLSDHLNNSATHVMIETREMQSHTGDLVPVAGMRGQLSKHRLFFAIPITEPARPTMPDDSFWRPTARHQALATFGPYSVSGEIHLEEGWEPRSALRALDKQFIPFTDAILTWPGGQTYSCAAVIINRHNVDFLALREAE